MIYHSTYTDVPIPTVQLLIKELKELDDWYVFGVVLNIPVKKLRMIKSSNPHGGVEVWLIDMFQYWLNNNVDASWVEIVRALEQTDQIVLAASLKRKYLLPPEPAAVNKNEGINYMSRLYHNSNSCSAVSLIPRPNFSCTQ